MSHATRRHLARIVRRPDCDLAEAAALCCIETDPDIDVSAVVLRVDALADGLRSSGFTPIEPAADARALTAYLHGTLGFTGDVATYHDPDNALFTRVLDRKRGLPITLSVLYVAIARRLQIPAFGIGLPGHFVAGVGTEDRPVVVDPFHDGAILDERTVAQRVHAATDGRVSFTRSMLRPATPATIVRRILNNLTRDFTTEGDYREALWTVETKLLLPGSPPDDHRARGELLLQLGRFRDAADAFETYVEQAPDDAPDRDEMAARAVRSRAKLN
ncbi:MAG: transglutaminase-like domain-containing protein [Nitriliruptorales bacterium]|nr:transglutaminase-like domain-containing protein [Nitriliruptorales bacterium]